MTMEGEDGWEAWERDIRSGAEPRWGGHWTMDKEKKEKTKVVTVRANGGWNDS